MSTFNPLIPTGTVNLNVDYKNIQLNFQQLDTSFGKDHYAFSNNTTNNGYHKVVHMVPVSTISNPMPNPPAVPFTGELFTNQINDGISSQETLYFQTGGGLLFPLTRNFVPNISLPGSSFIAGGLMIQWGKITSAVSGSVTPVSFDRSFPNNCFGVWANLQKTTSQSSVDVVYCTGFNGAGPVTGFSYYSTSSGNRDINWIAIGL